MFGGSGQTGGTNRVKCLCLELSFTGLLQKLRLNKVGSRVEGLAD